MKIYEELKVFANAKFRRVGGRLISGLSTNIQSVKVTAQLRSASGNGTSISAIEASKVNVEGVSLELIAAPYKLPSLSSESETETLLEVSIDIKSLTPTELEEFLKDVAPEYLRLVPYAITESNYLGTFKLKSKSANTRTLEPSLVSFSHFLPARLIRKYIIEERRKSRLRRTIDMALNYPGDITNKAISELLDLEFLDSSCN